MDNYANELKAEEEIFSAQEKKEIQNNEDAKENLLSVASSGKNRVCNTNQWSKSLSNHTLQSATDKDARVSVKPGKARRLNYLAQVSVDIAKTGEFVRFGGTEKEKFTKRRDILLTKTKIQLFLLLKNVNPTINTLS